MSKDYQPSKDSKYHIPHDIYMRTIWLIRGHNRVKAERDAIINSTPIPEPGRSSIITSSTENKAMRLLKLGKEYAAVEKALKSIQEEYRTGVYNNIAYRMKYPEYASKNTWSKYRQLFIYNTAKNMDWI